MSQAADGHKIDSSMVFLLRNISKVAAQKYLEGKDDTEFSGNANVRLPCRLRLSAQTSLHMQSSTNSLLKVQTLSLREKREKDVTFKKAKWKYDTRSQIRKKTFIFCNISLVC